MMVRWRNILFITCAGMAVGCASIPKPAKSEKRLSESLVTFQNQDFTLEGTLCLPETDPGKKVPGVVIVHGSGPSSRDGFTQGQLNMGFGFTIPVYAELACACG